MPPSQCIQFCLKQRFGFTDQQIVVLRDDSRHPDFTSTKANIFRSITWLMTDQRPGDSLFFHFSGHGSQQYDRNGDEADGMDETICPTDFQRAGQIVDDELNRLMVRPLMPGVTLHAVIDACHSGTALDLPFRAKVDGRGQWYWKGRGRYDKQTMGGTAFQFGACKDSQVAQDTNALSGKAYTGAATFCFIQAIEKLGVATTYGQILGHMMQSLRAATGGGGLNLGSTGSMIASFLMGPAASMLTGGGQTPVLSCDKQVDLYQTRLSL
ncbi:Metacaspase-1 [Tetrabaena socialis]|uniref:Metacaspase-1 n=1 Tax=Tetrabaena socialis TaxID=47790 RepID=A0A2J7ZSS0_9CHLO|nr:Metacaspase-1 [Tetrabaena socialis]|eukprot:PNH03319.1 Metacaspase-1 [Tetrabaena socialis]